MVQERQPTGRSERRGGGERKPREERWPQLLETATEVFYEKGYEGASLQAIAERLGMLKGSLFYYIRSKEDLLFHVLSAVHRDGLAVITSKASSDGTPLVRLERMIRGHVEHTCRNPVSTAVFLRELKALQEERRREILGTEHAYQGVFRDLVAEAQIAGLVRPDVDARLAGLSILGSTNWVYRWFRPGGSAPPEEIGRQLAEMAIRGVATEEAIADWEATRLATAGQP